MSDGPEVTGSGYDETAFQAILDADNGAGDGEAPETGDTPAPRASAEPPDPAAAPAREGDPEPRTDGRDALGRFTAKEQTEAPADPAKAALPDATPPNTPAPAAPDDAKAREAAFAESVQPFVVKYGNREHDVLPGSVLTPQGLVIPLDQVQQVHTMAGRMLKYEAERQVLREQELRSKQAEQHWQAKAETFGPAIDQLFGLAGMPDRTDAEVEAKMLAAYEFVAQLGRERPILEQKEQLARERAELQLQRELAQPDPETARAQIVANVVATADEHLGQIRQHLSALTDEDLTVLRQRVEADPERYAYRVGPRLSPEELDAGFKPGDLAFDGRVLVRDAEVVAKYREREVMARKQAEEAIRAAQRNATTAAATAGVPPTPTTTAPAAPAAPKKAAKPPADDDWDGWFEQNIAAELKKAVA
jgi:hypothetical protein